MFDYWFFTVGTGCSFEASKSPRFPFANLADEFKSVFNRLSREQRDLTEHWLLLWEKVSSSIVTCLSFLFFCLRTHELPRKLQSLAADFLPSVMFCKNLSNVSFDL